MRRKRRVTQTLFEGMVSPGITVQDPSRHDSVLVPVSSRRIEKAEKVCAKTVVIMYHMVDTVHCTTNKAYERGYIVPGPRGARKSWGSRVKLI